ncbi:hypothetical protein DFH94DRAFT_145679 [Russula ochroleuca]|uniref:Transmembrane protein n=1 Tax=Russula ochroleuca TaxID=152965 RepID=A0A9P5MQD7_9AGAM|nr:hypothetical protein DFH94DRAFT_145679 [Russula ochroleuca]
MFRFRAFRKCWLVTVAVASLACIAISPSLYNYYESKSDLCVLIAVPGLCLTASIAAIFARRFFPSTSVPTSVAVECIWTACFVIFNLILSLYSLGMEGDVKRTSAHMPFLLVEICCWSLTGLMATYASLITILSILTAATVDKDVWFRDIAGSPSPFPVAACLYSTKLWFTDIRSAPSGMGSSTGEHLPHCLPMCSCKEKISPSSPPMALPPLGILSDPRLDGCVNARSIVPGVRVPTAMERHNSIFVGLEV